MTDFIFFQNFVWRQKQHFQQSFDSQKHSQIRISRLSVENWKAGSNCYCCTSGL